MIETTHVGSLPRGDELTPLLLARDAGDPYDAEAFDRLVGAAVDKAVEQQIACDVSVVSDGELGKVGGGALRVGAAVDEDEGAGLGGHDAGERGALDGLEGAEADEGGCDDAPGITG